MLIGRSDDRIDGRDFVAAVTTVVSSSNLKLLLSSTPDVGARLAS